MATIWPELSELELSKLPSDAEARLYRAFRDHLPPEFVVLFQVCWVLRKEDGGGQEGEADFIVCHPDNGSLCIEVKGGGIGFDSASGSWYSIDRHSVKHQIKSPINQAVKAKYSIREKLQENARWCSLNLDRALRGHAVFFPDIGDPRALQRPELPLDLIGVYGDLSAPQAWIEKAFKFWSRDTEAAATLGRAGIEIIKKTFARSFYVQPLISKRLAEQEAIRVRLTANQMMVLDFLTERRRAAVRGGAGTGKTLLAVEKAKRLAQEGHHTLLTCYNRRLADHLADVCKDITGLDVQSFHQLCYRFTRVADAKSGRNLVLEAKATYPGTDLYDVQWPNALAYATEILPDRYDAIVCDEGQDFREEYWVPLELLLSDYEGSPLYIFYDDNQNIYSRASTFPIREPPYTLTRNCRNTAKIHEQAYRHYSGVPVTPPLIEGDDVEFIESPSWHTQARAITGRVTDLIVNHSVSAEEIVILVVDAPKKKEFYAALEKHPLPGRDAWNVESDPRVGGVLLDTVSRFKGLESDVVFLWGLDTVEPNTSGELLYVGTSRAKSLLVVVGNAATCERFRMYAEAHREHYPGR